MDDDDCAHENTIKDGGNIVCKDCGMVLEESIDFGDKTLIGDYSDSQMNYEREIRLKDSKAMQDPKVRQKYEKIKTLDIWFRDYQTSFTQQKKTIELLKGYGIGLSIDKVKQQYIKKRYLKYLKVHRRSYQNMVIIFHAIVWMEIKDTTNTRIERFIEVINELGHKINKKMLNNAMEKVKRTETEKKRIKTSIDIEKEIKNKIKILFQKDLNHIPFERIKNHFATEEDYYRLKIEMSLKADALLGLIKYNYLKNLNYKAFTASLIYYIGQSILNPKIFTQSLIEDTTKFSSTTIRKKYKLLKGILGDPKKLSHNNS